MAERGLFGKVNFSHSIAEVLSLILCGNELFYDLARSAFL